uniref:TDRD6 protein n=1 Tax=Fopius arisanus TaxID=64838 RepID=A0A0C9Q5Z7_9HYME
MKSEEASPVPLSDMKYLGDQFPVQVLSTNGPNDIWIRPESLRSDYLTLSRVLSGYYESLGQKRPLGLSELSQGMLVGVLRFGVHRAVIKELPDDPGDAIDVWYIDDACSGQVMWHELIQLDDVFKKIPRMAIHCGLVGVAVIDNLWSDACSLLQDFTFGMSGVLHVENAVEENSSFRGNISVNGEDLGDLLLRRGYATERKYYLRQGF